MKKKQKMEKVEKIPRYKMICHISLNDFFSRKFILYRLENDEGLFYSEWKKPGDVFGEEKETAGMDWRQSTYPGRIGHDFIDVAAVSDALIPLPLVHNRFTLEFVS